MSEALRKKADQCGRVLTSEDQGDFVAGHVTVRLPGRSAPLPDEARDHRARRDDAREHHHGRSRGPKVGGTMPRHNEVFIHSEVLARATGPPCGDPYACAARGRVLVARQGTPPGQQRGRLLLQEAAGVLGDHRPHRDARARQGGGELPRAERRRAAAQPRHRQPPAAASRRRSGSRSSSSAPAACS